MNTKECQCQQSVVLSVSSLSPHHHQDYSARSMCIRARAGSSHSVSLSALWRHREKDLSCEVSVAETPLERAELSAL